MQGTGGSYAGVGVLVGIKMDTFGPFCPFFFSLESHFAQGRSPSPPELGSITDD